MKEVTLVLTDKPLKFSLSHLNSDYIDNTVILEQVVGTLVKYSKNGTYQPFLAERWSVSDDELKWNFELKSDLYDQNNDKINAEKFVKNLKKLLKIYSKKQFIPVFNQLIGWDDFVSDLDADKFGISFNHNSIIFNFKTKPSGLLEFLSMPYYGYYHEKDFNNQNEWVSEDNIISTGAYTVEKKTDYEVELRARKNFFTYNAELPQKVKIKFDTINNIKNNDYSNQNIIVSVRDGLKYNLNNLVQFNTTPRTSAASSHVNDWPALRRARTATARLRRTSPSLSASSSRRSAVAAASSGANTTTSKTAWRRCFPKPPISAATPRTKSGWS